MLKKCSYNKKSNRRRKANRIIFHRKGFIEYAGYDVNILIKCLITILLCNFITHINKLAGIAALIQQSDIKGEKI